MELNRRDSQVDPCAIRAVHSRFWALVTAALLAALAPIEFAGASGLAAPSVSVYAQFAGHENGDGSGNPCSVPSGLGYRPDSDRLTWSCGVHLGRCDSSATMIFDLSTKRISAQCALTAPVGAGRATPATLAAGGNVLLTATVTPASSPMSSGIVVLGDLSAIGGSGSQVFLDDGSNGDVVAADGVFSYLARLPYSLMASPGEKRLPLTVFDAQARSGSAQIVLTVLAATLPLATGAASPPRVGRTENTLLSVAVTPGTSPASSGITARADLRAIGGAAAQMLNDAGNSGDLIAGDGVYSYRVTLPDTAVPGAQAISVLIGDIQGRTANATINVEVLPPTAPSGFARATPDNVDPLGLSLLTVTVNPGQHPTSSGISVSADLQGIGGAPAQLFADDGTNGDAVPGDLTYSYSAVVQSSAQPGTLAVPVTIRDSSSRSANLLLPLVVTTPNAMHLEGVATPLRPNAGTLVHLSVTVRPATGPSSSNILVGADLSAVGGSPTQVFFDSGGGVHTYALVLPAGLPSAPVRITAIATDAEGRSGRTDIVVDVLSATMFEDQFE